MTPEAQRIAIAKACGIQDSCWVADGLLRRKFMGWVGPDDNTGKHVPVPDYLKDLNAMHEAETVIGGDLEVLLKYTVNLHKITNKPDMTGLECMLFHVTAAQRAEAFLRSLSLWDDTK